MVNQKAALESLWTGSCTIYVKQTSLDERTKKTVAEDVAVYENRPCKLSFETIKSTSENSDASLVSQAVKLFISSEVQIPPGSKIVVTQNGSTGTYSNSGLPARYKYHQEIPLELFKKYA